MKHVAAIQDNQIIKQNQRVGRSQLQCPLLYLLTNDDAFELLQAKLEVALSSGVVSLLQIRRKQLLAQPQGRVEVLQESQKIIELANRYQVPVVMNDNIEWAQQLNIGVHLGQEDGSLVEARQRLGNKAIIGRTCHQSVALVKQAKLQGADYAAMGAVFSSATKPEAELVSRQQLIEGCQQGIDICVIGGISIDNISIIRGLPIRYIALVGDIMSLPVDKIAARCEAWRQVLTDWFE